MKHIVKFDVSALLPLLDVQAFFLHQEHEIMELVADMADIDDMSILEYVSTQFPEVTVTEDNFQELLIEIFLKVSSETDVAIV